MALIRSPDQWRVKLDGFDEMLALADTLAGTLNEVERLKEQLMGEIEKARTLADALTDARGNVFIDIPEDGSQTPQADPDCRLHI